MRPPLAGDRIPAPGQLPDASDDGPGATVVPVDLAARRDRIPGPTELHIAGTAGDAPAACWTRQGVALACRLVVGPLVGAASAGLMVHRNGTTYESAMIVFLAFALSACALRRPPRHSRLLSMVGATVTHLPVLIGAALLAAADVATGLPSLSADQLAISTLLAALPALLLPPLFPVRRPVRTAVIGDGVSGEMLARELAVAGVSDYRLVGAVAADDRPDSAASLPRLGALADLGAIVQEHGIDLLVLTGEAPRMEVFDELARSCLHLPVRLWELAGFCEETFGHVPVAEINSSWFQYIMHPHYRTSGTWAKRALDVAVAATVGMATLPVIGILALLIRRDGGPALFTQDRIGEGGRPFTVYKLRTMHVGAGDATVWAEADDPRTTRLGRILRRTHLDELPQIWNVLRGEMSLVGPRPEQPGFVDRLERTIPFYSRRHLIKPGVTGWAQVRCGYAGSDFGSAWKLCHDLYYLKHRSFWLDVAIIAETARTLVADRQYDVEPVGVSFILRPALAEGAPQASVAAL